MKPKHLGSPTHCDSAWKHWGLQNFQGARCKMYTYKGVSSCKIEPDTEKGLSINNSEITALEYG